MGPGLLLLEINNYTYMCELQTSHNINSYPPDIGLRDMSGYSSHLIPHEREISSCRSPA